MSDPTESKPVKKMTIAQMNLTMKQEAFAQHYVRLRNASAAYRLAYDVDPETWTKEALWVQACNTKKHPKVALRIAELQEQIAQTFELSAERVVQELVDVAFANIHDFIELDEDGGAALDLSGVTRRQAKAIAEMTSETYDEGRGEEKRTVKRTKVKLSNKLDALEKLGRTLGIFKDGLELSTKDGKPLMIDDGSKRELARWIAFTLAKGSKDVGPAAPKEGPDELAKGFE